MWNYNERELFRRYRLKNAILDLSNVKDPSDMQDESHRRVLHSIRAHQHAIKFVSKLDWIIVSPFLFIWFLALKLFERT